MQIEMLSQEIEGYNDSGFYGKAVYLTDLSFEVYDYFTVFSNIKITLNKLRKKENEIYDFTLRVDGSTACWSISIEYCHLCDVMPLSLEFSESDYEIDRQNIRTLIENFIFKYENVSNDFAIGDIKVDVFSDKDYISTL